MTLATADLRPGELFVARMISEINEVPYKVSKGVISTPIGTLPAPGVATGRAVSDLDDAVGQGVMDLAEHRDAAAHALAPRFPAPMSGAALSSSGQRERTRRRPRPGATSATASRGPEPAPASA